MPHQCRSESEFAEYFAALEAERTAAGEKIVENRFKMRELMSAEEWSRVYTAKPTGLKDAQSALPSFRIAGAISRRTAPCTGILCG